MKVNYICCRLSKMFLRLCSLCCVVDQINESACCTEQCLWKSCGKKDLFISSLLNKYWWCQKMHKLKSVMFFSHHLPWWDNVGDEKQWTGRNVSRAGKKWFITFITPCRAFCLPYLIKSMGNWMTIILLMVSKMMRKKKPKKVTWILCSEYKPPSASTSLQ